MQLVWQCILESIKDILAFMSPLEFVTFLCQFGKCSTEMQLILYHLFAMVDCTKKTANLFDCFGWCNVKDGANFLVLLEYSISGEFETKVLSLKRRFNGMYL